jgi:hypothetical protein
MVEWSEYVRYRCRYCQDECINHADAAVTADQICRPCNCVPDLATASEGTGAEARPEAQRSEHPGPARERQSRGVPERPAGSGGLWPPEPEARAQPPTGGRGTSCPEAPAASERTPEDDNRRPPREK